MAIVVRPSCSATAIRLASTPSRCWSAYCSVSLAIRAQPAPESCSTEFKRHLKVERGWKPSSVNLAPTAVDHFNRFLGLGPGERRARAAGAGGAQSAVGGAAAGVAAQRRGVAAARSGNRDLAAVHRTWCAAATTSCWSPSWQAIAVRETAEPTGEVAALEFWNAARQLPAALLDALPARRAPINRSDPTCS